MEQYNYNNFSKKQDSPQLTTNPRVEMIAKNKIAHELMSHPNTSVLFNLRVSTNYTLQIRAGGGIARIVKLHEEYIVVTLYVDAKA